MILEAAGSTATRFLICEELGEFWTLLLTAAPKNYYFILPVAAVRF